MPATRGLADPIGGQAGRQAPERAGADADERGGRRGPRDVDRAARGQAGRGERPDPGPHRVQLPLVSEVAEHRVARAAGRDRRETPRGDRSGRPGVSNGPSRTKASTTTPPTTASEAVTSSSVRQPAGPATDASRCGKAWPIVSAATSTASPVPRRSRNQPAAILSPVGYTAASAKPVAKRSRIASVRPVRARDGGRGHRAEHAADREEAAGARAGRPGSAAR